MYGNNPGQINKLRCGTRSPSMFSILTCLALSNLYLVMYQLYCFIHNQITSNKQYSWIVHFRYPFYTYHILNYATLHIFTVQMGYHPHIQITTLKHPQHLHFHGPKYTLETYTFCVTFHTLYISPANNLHLLNFSDN